MLGNQIKNKKAKTTNLETPNLGADASNVLIAGAVPEPVPEAES